MSYIYDLADTWNASGTTFTAVKMNVTDTASAAGSLLMDLQIGSASKFQVTKGGNIQIANNATIGAIAVGPFIRVTSAYPYLTFNAGFGISSGGNINNPDVYLLGEAANTLAQRNGTVAQESRVYGSYTAADNFQRMSIKTLRESSGALSGASYTTTIAIPAYANLIGVTTRVTTAITGATTYDVGDGSDVDLWGAAIGAALGSQSRTADFTAVTAVGAAATSRTVTLTANGSNFTGGVVEICLHYLTTEAD